MQPVPATHVHPIPAISNAGPFALEHESMPKRWIKDIASSQRAPTWAKLGQRPVIKIAIWPPGVLNRSFSTILNLCAIKIWWNGVEPIVYTIFSHLSHTDTGKASGFHRQNDLFIGIEQSDSSSH
jgi:hypothetical protein